MHALSFCKKICDEAAKMKISVVIPMRNASSSIDSCLQSLTEQEEQPYEIIVIDNQSTDDSRLVVKKEIEKFNYIRLIVNSGRSLVAAASRNIGIESAKGDIIAFTDSDCIADKYWIKNIRVAFEQDSSLDAIGGVEKGGCADISLSGKFLSAFWLPDTQKITKRKITGKADFFRNVYLVTFNCAFKRSILIELGGFDEIFSPAGEDTDLWMRACEQKATIFAWDPKMVVTHHQDITFYRLLKKSFSYGESHAHTTKRHFKNNFILQLPFVGQIKMNIPYFTFVITQHFTKLVLLLIILGMAFYVSLAVGSVTFFLALSFFFFKLRNCMSVRGYKVSLWHSIVILGIFVCREISEQLGRVYGSFKHKVICL